MRKLNVLFICVQNSARSQMAEGILKHMAQEQFQAYSAGIEPGVVNPLIIIAMKELSIDISHHQSKSIEEIMKRQIPFNYVISVCDGLQETRCPSFPGKMRRIHWPSSRNTDI